MKHIYMITGMTCDGCVATVKNAMLKLPGVLSAEVSPGKAVIEMDKHISTETLQNAISPGFKYVISEEGKLNDVVNEKKESFFSTYKPLLLIFSFITCLSLIKAFTNASFNLTAFMDYFMAGFFITFSFFKLLDIKGFANAYAMYDLLAKKLPAYGFIYPFIELALGIAYLTGYNPVITNSATILVMGFSSIGVIQSVLNKTRIKCACLGAVFNLPMSTVTIIEDLLMVAMAAVALIKFV